MKKIKLVIFDCDGVLVDSEPIANEVFAQHLSQIGLPHTTDQAMSCFMGRSMKSCLSDVLQDLQVKKLPIPADFPASFFEAMQRDTFAAFEKNLKPIDGIISALDAIEAAGIQTCVASSGDHAKMKVTLGLCGLYDRFEGRIFSATQVLHGKPAPDLFLFAAGQMGFDPPQCLVVEDSPAGVQAAVAAGIYVVGYTGLTSQQSILSGVGASEAKEHGRLTLISSMNQLLSEVL